MIESRCEDDVRDASFALDEFFQDAEAVKAGHLDVEKNEIGGMLFDEVDGFEAVFSLADEIDLGKSFQEKGELLPGWLFVVDDERVDRHGRDTFSISALAGRKKDLPRGRVNTEEIRTQRWTLAM